MRDVQELRQTLEEHAVLAPDGAGVVEAAQAGAVKVRRRRRLVSMTAAVAAVAVLVAVAPVAISRLGGADPRPDAAGSSYRGPMQLTVDLAAGSGYFDILMGMEPGRQFIEARSGKGSGNWGGSINVYDPGTFDPAPLLAGEPVTVQGHTAYYVDDLLIGKAGARPEGALPLEREVRVPAVGWPDPSGAWVVVDRGMPGEESRTGLFHVAEAVRLTEPRDIRSPFHLSYVPGGLPARYVVGDGIAFSRDRLPEEGSPNPPPIGLVKSPLTIAMWPAKTGHPEGDKEWPSILAELGSPTHTIGGHQVWYLAPARRPLTGPAAGSILILKIGECNVTISVTDRNQVPFEELKRMVEGAQFKNCEDKSTWVPPLD